MRNDNLNAGHLEKENKNTKDKCIVAGHRNYMLMFRDAHNHNISGRQITPCKGSSQHTLSDLS